MSTASTKANPFSAPMATEVLSNLTSAPPKRASDGRLRLIRNAMNATELSFALMSASFLLLLCVNGSWLADLIYPLLGCAIITLGISTGVLLLACNRTGLFFLFIFLFLIPMFGVFIYFAAILGAKKFMLENGYVAGWIGFVPDQEERKNMLADPFYVPDQKLRKDGSKRAANFVLTEKLLIGAVLLAVIGLIAMALFCEAGRLLM